MSLRWHTIINATCNNFLGSLVTRFNVPRHGIHSMNFVNDMHPCIRTYDSKVERERIIDYCLTGLQGISRLQYFCQLHKRHSSSIERFSFQGLLSKKVENYHTILFTNHINDKSNFIRKL